MLWAHEMLRVFSDRLIDDDDRKYFGGMVVDSLKVQFKISKSYEDIFCSEQKLVFGDYTKMGVPRDDIKKYESYIRDGARRLVSSRPCPRPNNSIVEFICTTLQHACHMLRCHSNTTHMCLKAY